MQAYVAPPARTRVICLDERGPLVVRTYPGATYGPRVRRATFEPDYGRRGVLWVHGAFEPATGEAAFVLSAARDGASHIRLLEHVPARFPSERWLIIEDNVTTHSRRDVRAALVASPEVTLRFRPKYAAWLNLIEPWWKQLKNLALKGRRFETRSEREAALHDALADWNAHRHPYPSKKAPQQQPLLAACGQRGERTTQVHVPAPRRSPRRLRRALGGPTAEPHVRAVRRRRALRPPARSRGSLYRWCGCTTGSPGGSARPSRRSGGGPSGRSCTGANTCRPLGPTGTQPGGAWEWALTYSRVGDQ